MVLFSFPQWDTDLFSYLNAKHIDWLDPVMVFLSSHWSWIILFLIVSFFMIRRSKFWGSREILLILCTVGFNSIANNIVKLIIKRPRPCDNDMLGATIRILEDCGTHYSFFSAHSSNAICLALCTAFYFRNKYYSILMVIWALVVAYSRIYVGKHYPLDIMVGIVFGIIISVGGNCFLRKYREEKRIKHAHIDGDIN